MSVDNSLRWKLLGIFSGALIGYVWGWTWGWSLVDPERDVWALAAALAALIGLLLGLMTARFWQVAGSVFGATLGLYLGWLLRTLIVGDVPGGFGLARLLAGASGGGLLGARPSVRDNPAARRALIGALVIGFFGGFLIDVVLLDLALRIVTSHSILSQAPAVIVCGVLGGWLAARLGSKRIENQPAQ